MLTKSYRRQWQKLHRKEKKARLSFLDEGYAESPDQFSAQFLLWVALRTYYSRSDDELARALLQKSNQIAAECVVAFENLGLPFVGEFHPQTEEQWNRYSVRPEVLKTKHYTQAILGGPIDSGALLLAAGDMVKISVYSRDVEQHWDEYQESECLNAVRIALIVGDHSLADEFLHVNPSFKANAVEHQLLRKLSASVFPGDEVLLEAFDAHFDELRNPRYKPEASVDLDLARLEYGILRDKLINGPDGPIDWQRVIDTISM